MQTSYYCPVKGLEIALNKEWLNQQVSKTFTANFSLLGNSIIYSAPSGTADLKGVKSSLELNQRVAETLQSENKYVQIEDYLSLDNSSLEARLYFTKKMNENKNLHSLIFCNTSQSLKLAIKLSNRLNTNEKQIHICNNYPEAIKLAVKICADNNFSINSGNTSVDFKNLQNPSYLKPVKVSHSPNMLVADEDLNDPVSIIDDDILMSKPAGVLMKKHLPALNIIWQKLIPLSSDDEGIKYILIDGENLVSFHPGVLRPYGKLLRALHKFDPIKMHIIYNTSDKIKKASIVANSFMPFEITTANDLKEAYQLINQDKEGKKPKKKSLNNETASQELFEFLNNIDWTSPGCSIPTNEDHPDFVIMNAIKLIKEESDNLHQENSRMATKLEQAANENHELLRELQHRIRNSFFLIKGLIQMKKKGNLSDETIKTLEELEGSFTAVSNQYELLDNPGENKKTNLKTYLELLINSYSSTQNIVSFKTDFEEIEYSTNSVVPIGLIITELITNSFKHAFHSVDDKNIAISLKKSDDGFCLEYSDNGPGLYNSGKDKKCSSRGLGLINTLSQQIGTTICYPPSDGFYCVLRHQQ